MKVKKHFYLKISSSIVKIFCSDTHLKNFLIFYKYVTIKLSSYKYIWEQLNYKKNTSN